MGSMGAFLTRVVGDETALLDREEVSSDIVVEASPAALRQGTHLTQHDIIRWRGGEGALIRSTRMINSDHQFLTSVI